MTKLYFNAYGYKIITSKDESQFLYDLPNDIVNHATALYLVRWMVFNQALDELKNLKEGKELTLYTDSKLLEELQLTIEPDSHYAKSSLQYFLKYDYPRWRRIYFEKCPSSIIDNKIREPVCNSRS